KPIRIAAHEIAGLRRVHHTSAVVDRGVERVAVRRNAGGRSAHAKQRAGLNVELVEIVSSGSAVDIGRIPSVVADGKGETAVRTACQSVYEHTGIVEQQIAICPNAERKARSVDFLGTARRQ